MEESSPLLPLYCWYINSRKYFYSTFHYNKMYVIVEIHTRLFNKFTNHLTSLTTEKGRKANPSDVKWYFLVEQHLFKQKKKKFYCLVLTWQNNYQNIHISVYITYVFHSPFYSDFTWFHNEKYNTIPKFTKLW